MDPLDDILTVEQAAELLGCSALTVTRALRKGILPGVKFGWKWRLSRKRLVQRFTELVDEQGTPNPVLLPPQVKAPVYADIDLPMPPQHGGLRNKGDSCK